MTKKLSIEVPKHLIGEGYEMMDAPPFGPEEEKGYVEDLRQAREGVIAFLPREIGDTIKDGDIEGTITGVIINRPKSDQYTYVYSYTVEEKKKVKTKTGQVSEALQPERMDREYAKAMAHYQNERHQFILRYSFAVRKIAGEHYKQCHCGMGFDDLSNTGFMAIANVADKWPPFLGAKDAGKRILATINAAIRNAVRRFLDDNNRKIKVPSYKLEQVTVRLKADNILYGKRKPAKKNMCDKKTCKKCKDLHGKACRRSKPGKFELSIQDLLINIYDIEGTKEEQWPQLVKAAMDIDNKSLRDFANQTGRYREVAEAASLDIGSVISMFENTASIDTPTEDGEGTIADIITQEEHDSSHSVRSRRFLEEAIDQIPKRNGDILRDRFFNEMSTGEIAEKYGFSVVRASELIKKSVNQIRGNAVAMNILVHRIVGE